MVFIISFKMIIYFLFDGENSISMFNLKTDSLLAKNMIIDGEKTPKEALKLEKKLKAIIQQFNNRLISNQLSVRE